MAHVTERGERFSHLLALELKGAISTYGFVATKVASAVDVDYSTLYRYFKGERSLPATVFSDVCEVIGVDPAELVDRAYKRLVKEMGSYRAVDAKVIDLYTPSRGVPVIEYDQSRHAAKRTKHGPEAERMGSLEIP